MTHVADLTAALDALLQACARAAAELPNEDTTAVVAQARKAVELMGELSESVHAGAEGTSATAASERSLHLLHGLNNKLTSAMSLTMLAREDLAPGHAADGVLALVEARARTAASAARAVADAVKQGAPGSS